MGFKYRIDGFHYPFLYVENEKQTSWLIVCVFWFIIFSVIYDGVDVQVRK
jgi:hypothetical protein|nr:MAG TPA: hypothetical protein [Bacteriophage sp.]